jgi:hypothetical protein
MVIPPSTAAVAPPIRKEWEETVSLHPAASTARWQIDVIALAVSADPVLK